MFAYISGRLEDKGIDNIVIDVNGIGYKIFIPVAKIDKIGNIGDNVKVHTYYYVREDNISLYGFGTKEELRVFELLLLVSGVGAKMAINIISEIEPYDFSLAVISSDVKTLTKVSGVGPKVAQRIILELKDRLKTETAIQNNSASKENTNISLASLDTNEVAEAMSALQVLGYNIKDIKVVMQKIENLNEMKTEEIIKKGLIYLGR